jgi:hypothetical protein
MSYLFDLVKKPIKTLFFGGFTNPQTYHKIPNKQQQKQH